LTFDNKDGNGILFVRGVCQLFEAAGQGIGRKEDDDEEEDEEAVHARFSRCDVGSGTNDAKGSEDPNREMLDTLVCIY
jgi:hypothetical protein